MIQMADLTERWANVQRVLEAMPEHERQRHWDMSTWGTVTECGTIACAAGHCGLDPWFRDRGFKLDIVGRGAEISNVAEFFGMEGAGRIFFNIARRPVEAVIVEVRAYRDELNRNVALMAGAPAIGDAWPEQGGIYAGARLGLDGGAPYHLIVGPEHDDRLTWQAATDYAASLTHDGHADYVLPLPVEQITLFDRVRALFQREAYWSGKQHESYSSYAYSTYFNNGTQVAWDKDVKLRARVVRRLPI